MSTTSLRDRQGEFLDRFHSLAQEARELGLPHLGMALHALAAATAGGLSREANEALEPVMMRASTGVYGGNCGRSRECRREDTVAMIDGRDSDQYKLKLENFRLAQRMSMAGYDSWTRALNRYAWAVVMSVPFEVATKSRLSGWPDKEEFPELFEVPQVVNGVIQKI